MFIIIIVINTQRVLHNKKCMTISLAKDNYGNTEYVNDVIYYTYNTQYSIRDALHNGIFNVINTYSEQMTHIHNIRTYISSYIIE